MILYRPVGTNELELIVKSGYAKYPPRLPEQPIFYPVLNERYAAEIAARWNVKYNCSTTKFLRNTDKIIENFIYPFLKPKDKQ